MSQKTKTRKIRYAVVALGHIAQVAVLPAFKNARRNSEVAALVSGDPEKLRQLGRRYGVTRLHPYEEFEDCLRSGAVDAVYLALPNHMHFEYTLRAARAGVHVLCEKPLAVTAWECGQMVHACARSGVKLMTAYRLHFERANLEAIELVQSGKIGQPRMFSSTFGFQVRPGNARTRKAMGGGTLFDIGIYCINAARNLFRDEPVEVFAASVDGLDARSREVDATTSVLLRFPRDRMAMFTTSFASSAVATYQVIGSAGRLDMENAYEYASGKKLTLEVEGRRRTRSFPRRDQFAAELVYFSDCILQDRNPVPDGEEGWADVLIVEALFRSLATGRPVKLKPVPRRRRPSMALEISLPPVQEPPLVKVKPPHMG